MEPFIVICLTVSPLVGLVLWSSYLLSQGGDLCGLVGDDPSEFDCSCPGIGELLADPDTDDRSVTCVRCGAYADIGCGD